MKKINGYLVVKFNDRELREWEGTALGAYGVIDAELYTGCLDIDRSVMEYDGAETLEEAIEQARGLESELDVEEAPATYTIVTETDNSIEEEEVEPQLLVAGYETALEGQIVNPRFPDVNPATARHELYGFKVALNQLGLLDSEECFVSPETFADIPPVLTDYGDGEEDEERTRFENLPPEKRDSRTALQVYGLGRMLEQDCPENDCRLYLNIFNMCRSLDEQAPLLTGWAREVVESNLRKQFHELVLMFTTNYAIREYKRGLQP